MKSVVPFVIFNNTFSVCSQDLFQSLYPSPPISDRKLSYNGSAVSSPPSCADSSCLMAVTRSVARRLATARQQESDIAWESDEQRYFAELAAEGTRPSKRRKVWRSGQLKCAPASEDRELGFYIRWLLGELLPVPVPHCLDDVPVQVRRFHAPSVAIDLD